jgi:hypothetical protein
MIKRIIISSIIGILVYILIYSIKFPQYTFFGIDLGITTFPIKGGIDLPIVVIILIAVFCGPLTGFTVGFFGSLGADILFTNQLIVFGTINFSFGILGFIVGIPRYTQDQGFADGRKMAILLLYSFIGFLLMNFIYLVSLLVIANQSFVATLLYNFLPYFTIWVISLFLIAPVVVRITEIIIFQVMELWESRT